MSRPKSAPYLYVTWIARPLVGEKNCLWATWFKANNQGYAKVPSDFDSARWNMEHTDLMNKLVEKLEGRTARYSSRTRILSGSRAPAPVSSSAASRT